MITHILHGIRLALSDIILTLLCLLFLSSRQPVAPPALPATLPYATLITTTAARHQLDPALLAAVVQTESAFNPRALSAAGAMGLGQLMPATARACGLADPFDPAQNLDCAAWLLADLLTKYDLPLALAAYNAGEPAVLACHCIPHNGETNLYVPRVLAAYQALTAGEDLPRAASHAQLFALLYGGQPYYLTNPTLHGLAGWEGIDASAGCGATLYAPISGVVTFNGPDGYIGLYGGPSSMLTITAVDGTAISLLHGHYLPPIGDSVMAGESVIGVEGAVGNATGCHTHLAR